nr:type II toxin-antitoxin system PemK/MazF family toxin [Halohasta litchfieldiae]
MGIYRGDLVLVGLDPTQGSEQRGSRPCLVRKRRRHWAPFGRA